MKYAERSCSWFVDELASKAPVPGGGSVSALVGALGAALGDMVGELTVGKKKYADVENEIKDCMQEVCQVKDQLMALIQQDIDIFEPLSALYGMKADTDEEKAEKARLMEKALRQACQVPLDIMEQCARAIELSAVFAEKGSRLAVSDAGASAILCKSAMQAASLNVYINTNSMKDREKAAELNQACADMLAKYPAMADAVFGAVVAQLKK